MKLDHPIELVVDLAAAIGIITAVQVARRHPDYEKLELSKRTISFARTLYDSIRPFLDSKMVIFLDAGWNNDNIGS